MPKHDSDGQTGQPPWFVAYWTSKAPNIDHPIDNAREARAALVELRRIGDIAGSDGWAAFEQSMRQRRATVVLQWAESGIHVQQVGGIETAPAGGVTDQVVP